MFVIQPQNYVMTCQEHIFMSAMAYMILKEVKQTPVDPAILTLDKNDYSEWYKEK